MTDMNTIIYSRVSSTSQDNERQIINLKKIASEKGWTVKRVFTEKISGTITSSKRPIFHSMLEYLKNNEIDLVLISEVSRIGRRVVDVLNSVEMFHEQQIGLFIQQFNIITYQNGKEDVVAKMLLQMLSIGAEMENNMRKSRQLEGIELAKLNQKYSGRRKGAKADANTILLKYKDIADLIKNSELSLRRISQITGRSINTVRKVNNLAKVL
jgi:DNA invertase Pin-like site-specific DNA recombinase